MTQLPSHYFRVRENGAAVFRIDTENRQQRIEMQQIATVNVRNGEIKAQGGKTLTEDDQTQIEAWLAKRMKLVAARQLDEVQKTIDHLNATAHWANSKASDKDLENITDDLLMAMHDLRSVLVRKKSDSLQKN